MSSRAAQTAVGDVHHPLRETERDALAVRLVRLRVLVRPPRRRTHPLIRRHHPRASETVGAPGEAALPGGILRDLRTTVIVDDDRLRLAGTLRRLHRREERR